MQTTLSNYCSYRQTDSKNSAKETEHIIKTVAVKLAAYKKKKK